jgi:hypothetical protein
MAAGGPEGTGRTARRTAARRSPIGKISLLSSNPIVIRLIRCFVSPQIARHVFQSFCFVDCLAKMKRTRTVDSWFKRKPVTATENPDVNNDQAVEPDEMQAAEPAQNAHVPLVTEQARVLTTPFERDPGKRKQIWELSPAEQDDALRFYTLDGPYQPILTEYPFKGPASHRRRFSSKWFTDFWWLEYSPHTDRAYCFPCFLFSRKPVGKSGSDTFTVKGFQNLKKVNDGSKCAFLTHMGQDSSSAHNYSIQCYNNFKNRLTHIDQMVIKRNEKLVADARLRLMTTIDALR